MKTLRYIIIGFAMLSTVSCAKDKTPIVAGTDNIDAELYQMAEQLNDSLWYANVDSLFSRSSGSGHSQPFLTVRYNTVAGSKLGSDGTVTPGAIFPEGSLIVKNLYKDSTTIDLYAILYKKSNNLNADANGWVWGYMKKDGEVVVSAKGKGGSCINCHSQTGNINTTLMNKFYP